VVDRFCRTRSRDNDAESAHWRHTSPQPRTVGSDNAHDTADFVEQVHGVDMRLHVAHTPPGTAAQTTLAPSDMPATVLAEGTSTSLQLLRFSKLRAETDHVVIIRFWTLSNWRIT
jgi:hypothetical protein